MMRQRFDRLDGLLGRLFFRAAGTLCLLVALICAYASWWHVSRGLPHSWVPPLLFGICALAAGSCVTYCFARMRTFTEALDAMEGGVGDLPPKRSSKSS